VMVCNATSPAACEPPFDAAFWMAGQAAGRKRKIAWAHFESLPSRL